MIMIAMKENLEKDNETKTAKRQCWKKCNLVKVTICSSFSNRWEMHYHMTLHASRG